MSRQDAMCVLLTVQGDQYYADISSTPAARLPPEFCAAAASAANDSSDSHQDLALAAIWNFPGTYFGLQDLYEAKMQLEQTDDDVWSPAFAATIILRPDGHEVRLAEDLKNTTSHRVVCALHDADGRAGPQGPVVVQRRTGSAFQVFKLHRDTQRAFVGGVVPAAEPGRYRWLEGIDRIPIPYRQSAGQGSDADLPLRGLRFAVKDNIDVAGLETGCGSAAWRRTYGARDSTAPAVAQLVAAGATLVGKARCTQFCDGQDPLERLEEETPWNPRGDGFQKPSGSSSGPAAACAAYPWLDFTVGSDTGGSVRHPAAVNGVLGLRPSLGAVDTAGAFVACARMDTLGPLARSARVLARVARVMLRPDGPVAPIMSTTMPAEAPRFRLVVLTDSYHTAAAGLRFFPPEDSPEIPSRAALGIFSDVLRRLEQLSGEARWHVNPYDVWRKTHPAGAPDDLVAATEHVYPRLVYGELRGTVLGRLDRDHRARAAGRAAYVEPLLRARLAAAAAVTPGQRDAAARAFADFGTWVNRELLPPPDVFGGEIPLVVFPQSWGLPQYRDQLADRTGPAGLFWSGFSPYSLSYCSGCPDVTVPVGEVAVPSLVADVPVNLPVALSFLSPLGTDLELLALLEKFEAAGILRPVQCGPSLYQ